MKAKTLIAGLIVLLAPLSASAQESDPNNLLYADLQMLSRGEIRDGALPLSQESTTDRSAFILGRTRLNIGYKRPNLELKAIIQHLGIWGQAGKGDFNVQEAWAKVSSNKGLFAQIGRQMLSYDDERILGPNDWSMAGIAHDVLRAGYEGHGHKFHAVFAFNQNAANTVNGSTYYTGGALPYKAMYMGWYHYDLPVAPLGVSLLALNIGMQSGTPGEDEHMEWQHVLGGYAKYSPKRWSLEGTYYKQIGKDEEGSVLDAWMASAKACWNPSDVLGFVAGYDFLSGDKSFAVRAPGQMGLTHHDVLRGFNPIYGSHHAFYGAMDFFYVSTYVDGFTPGLQNAFVGVNVSPVKNMNLGLSYHYLAISTKLQDIGSTLGHEFELEGAWRFMKDAALACGFSYMFGTENMQLLKRASDDGRLLWTWLALSVTPRILNHSW